MPSARWIAATKDGAVQSREHAAAELLATLYGPSSMNVTRDFMTGVPAAGLCNDCAHQKVVRNTRGSVFSLCLRARNEPQRFVRYPRLPVVHCEGFERRVTDAPATGSG